MAVFYISLLMVEKLLSVFSLFIKPIEFEGFKNRLDSIFIIVDFYLCHYLFPPNVTSIIWGPIRQKYGGHTADK